MSIVKKGDNKLNLSDFKLKQSDRSFVDQLGKHIQKLIDNASKGDVIELPA